MKRSWINSFHQSTSIRSTFSLLCESLIDSSPQNLKASNVGSTKSSSKEPAASRLPSICSHQLG